MEQLAENRDPVEPIEVLPVILDTETTGFTNPEIIEFAMMLLGDINLYSLVTHEQRYKPAGEIEIGAMAAHHILPSDLVDCPPSSSFTPPNMTHLIAHNADFDWEILGKPDVKRICTLALSRHLWPGSNKHTVTALIYQFLGATPDIREMLKGAHSAMQDVNFTRIILRHILAEYYARGIMVRDFDHLWELSEIARVPTVMAFGKHRGEAIKDIPRSYCDWMLKQTDVDPYLAKALRERLGSK